MTSARPAFILLASLGLASACAASSSSGPVEPVPSSGAPISAAHGDVADSEPQPQPKPSPDAEAPPPPPPPDAETEDSVADVDEDTALRVPLKEVIAQAVYAPEPDQKELVQTKAARFDKTDGEGVVGFCVDTHGRTANIRTVQKFPDDPMVDRILRDTVARWRFKPWIVDGQVFAVCTERRWKLRFK